MKTMSKEFSNFYFFYVYSIDYKTEDNTYIFCGIESTKDEKLLIPEFIKLKNISWKSLYNLMNKIRNIWRMKHFNNELTLEFQSLSQFIFSKLKSCQENLNIREKNLILENDINTEFQTILFDFLYDEQELYAYYDELFKQKKYIPKKSKIPFGSFITNYQSLFVNIYNDDKKIKRLKKLRWYLPFDEDNIMAFSPSILFSFSNYNKGNNLNMNINNELNSFNNNYSFGLNNNNSLCGRDSFNEKENNNIYQKFMNDNESLEIKNDLKEYEPIEINEDMIDNLLDKEENPVLYIVKLISITIILFCRETMCHLNSIYNENNSAELIKEYIKRFNNFVQASKCIDSQCENVNVVMNYLDKDILKNYPHFQKFSIFRLCLKIWYSEMSSILTEDNCSLLSKIKNSSLKLFSEFLEEDLSNMKINNSFQSFLFNSGQSSFFGSEIMSKSKGNFNLSTSISLFNSNSNFNNQTVSSTICPFGSYYEDSYVKYTIIEKSLCIIYETFSDEYSVNLLNLSTIETNNYYKDIEDNVINIIQNCIKKMFASNVDMNNIDNKTIIKCIVDKILNYFNSYFYNQKILNKLKKRIYSCVVLTLKNLIFEQIEIKITKILSNSKSNSTDDDGVLNNASNEKYINELHQYLNDKKNMNIDINELKNILGKISITENIFEVLSIIDKWFNKEMQIIENTDKKVLKELKKNNISSSYNNLQRYLLSFSIRNNWETIRKIRAIENQHQKLNNSNNQKPNNDNSLKNSVNTYSLNKDLNNLSQFYSEDLNNFGNVDYFNEVNNDNVNNNNANDINNINSIGGNNNFNLGRNNLKSSNIFFS